VGLVTLACLVWVRHAHTNTLGEADPSLPGLSLGDVLREMLLWVFQSIAAFPMRDDPGAPATYAVWLTVFVTGIVLFFRRASARQRGVQAWLMVLFFAIPIALTLIAYPVLGLAWQGRYQLPLSVGMPLLAGWALSRHGARLSRGVEGVALGALGIAAAFSVVLVAHREDHIAPHPPLAELFPLGTVVAALLATVAPLALVWIRSRQASLPVEPPARVETVAS
jgi:hypothetical protein